MNFNLPDQTSRSWNDRAEKCVDMIEDVRAQSPHHLSVGDIGCGDMKLGSLMVARGLITDYMGFDLHPQSPLVTRFDVQSETLPRNFTVIVLLGVIEYMENLENLFCSLNDKCDFLIVSHVAADITNYSEDELHKLGWSTYLSSDQLEDIFESSGFKLNMRTKTAEGKTFLWLLQRQTNLHTVPHNTGSK